MLIRHAIVLIAHIIILNNQFRVKLFYHELQIEQDYQKLNRYPFVKNHYLNFFQQIKLLFSLTPNKLFQWVVKQ